MCELGEEGEVGVGGEGRQQMGRGEVVVVLDMSVLAVLIASYGSSSSRNDFPHEKGIDVCRQVQLLISQPTSHENVCQWYIG